MNEEKPTRITVLIAPFLERAGLTLYDIEIGGSPAKPILKIFIDSAKGVTHEDCALVSNHLSTLLDVEEVFRGEYIIEVSSPGLTRKLKKPEHFIFSIGKLAKVNFRNSFAGPKSAVGRLAVGRSDDTFVLECENEKIEFHFDDVANARLEFEG